MLKKLGGLQCYTSDTLASKTQTYSVNLMLENLNYDGTFYMHCWTKKVNHSIVVKYL